MASHSRPLAAMKRQLAWSAPFKKRLWQAIIRRKIENQSAVLSAVGRATPQMRGLARRVVSGDAGNIEAQAARLYFSRLFSGFKRHSGDKRNAALNYGYSGCARRVGALIWRNSDFIRLWEYIIATNETRLIWRTICSSRFALLSTAGRWRRWIFPKTAR